MFRCVHGNDEAVIVFITAPLVAKGQINFSELNFYLSHWRVAFFLFPARFVLVGADIRKEFTFLLSSGFI